MDTGASMAPYNHFELGSPLVVEHVWGRQLGDYTINPCGARAGAASTSFTPRTISAASHPPR